MRMPGWKNITLHDIDQAAWPCCGPLRNGETTIRVSAGASSACESRCFLPAADGEIWRTRRDEHRRCLSKTPEGHTLLPGIRVRHSEMRARAEGLFRSRACR